MADTLDAAASDLIYYWPWPPKRPDAIDDEAKTDEDSPVAIDVLDNDVGAYAITKVDGTAIGSGQSVTLDSGAKVYLKDYKLYYDPGDAFQSLTGNDTDSDTFTYTVVGYRKHTDTAKVDVTIFGKDDDTGENEAPIAHDDAFSVPYTYRYPYPIELSAEGTDATATTDAALTTDLDAPIYTTLAIGEEGDPDPYPVNLDVLSNDEDPDGDSLSVATIRPYGKDSIVVNPGGTVNLPSGALVEVNQDGSLTYSKGIMTYADPYPLPATGEAYTLVANADGSSDLVPIDPVAVPDSQLTLYPLLADLFTYTATDGDLSSEEAWVTVYRGFPYILGTEPPTEPAGTVTTAETDALLA